MARKRRRSIGDTVLLLVILAALVWAFAPGVGWDLLGLRSRLGWPPLRSGQALSSLPDSEAARQLRELTVRESVDDPAAPAYDREAFGQRWADTDHNGCDTRNDILARDLARPTFKPGTRDCVVLSGTLAEPYTGATIEFQRGDRSSSLVQIDHGVALGRLAVGRAAPPGIRQRPGKPARRGWPGQRGQIGLVRGSVAAAQHSVPLRLCEAPDRREECVWAERHSG